MTQSSRFPAALLLLAALAGCAAPAPLAEPQPAPTPPKHLDLSDCFGWDAASLPYPASEGPGTPPPGWEPEAATAGVRMGGYACHRLALGPFERPVKLVFDAHTRAAVPQSCDGTPHSHPALFVLENLWTDDAEVAGFLNTTYGFPARPTAIEARSQEVAGARLHTWTWGDARRPSSLTVADADAPWTLDRETRFFWPRGDGIGMLEVHYTFHELEHNWRPAHGTLEPPMLLAGRPAGTHVGTAAWLPSFSVTGIFTLYKDRACLEPEAWP